MALQLPYTDRSGVTHKKAYAKIEGVSIQYAASRESASFMVEVDIFATREIRDKSLSKNRPHPVSRLILSGQISELNGALEKGGKRPAADLRSVFYDWLSKRIPASDREIDFRKAEAV